MMSKKSKKIIPQSSSDTHSYLTFSAEMVSSRTIWIIFKKLDAEVLVKAEF